MSICTHCGGTGEAPIRLVQECIGCQRKVTLTVVDWSEVPKDGRVFCRECKPSDEAEIEALQSAAINAGVRFAVYSDETGEWLDELGEWTKDSAKAHAWGEDRADRLASSRGDGERWAISLLPPPDLSYVKAAIEGCKELVEKATRLPPRDRERFGQSALPRFSPYNVKLKVDPKAVDCPYCVKRPRNLREHCRAVHPNKPEAR